MRVIALQSLINGLCRTYGEGEYLGDLIPESGMFHDLKIKNPCIKLDNGNYVWGFMCWWGETEKFLTQYNPVIETTEIVEVEENIKPLA